jgi:hypothetical protein
MTYAHALVQVGLTIGRWLLPWVAVVFASATLVYAFSGAIAGDLSARGWPPVGQDAVSTHAGTGPAAVERSTTSPSGQSADPSNRVSTDRCPPIGPGFVDTVIVAESRRIACGQGAP